MSAPKPLIYRDLAQRRTGEERDILLALAAAEGRHEQHWLNLLGDQVGKPRRGDMRTRILGFLARHFGSVFVLALIQRAEARSTYDADADATATMAADERIHEEVVRLWPPGAAAGFPARSGPRCSVPMTAWSATWPLSWASARPGCPIDTVLATGMAGLLAGALSMGAGEYVSVRSQRELLEASSLNPQAGTVIPQLDIDANELALVYRARGMSEWDAAARAAEVLRDHSLGMRGDHQAETNTDEHEAVGTGLKAAISSFCFFASGALVPVLPYLFGLQGVTALVVAAALVGVALVATGVIVGCSPVDRPCGRLCASC